MKDTIDFIITNPRHHVEIVLPVIQHLQQKNVPCRIISFCEFRRMETPELLLKQHHILFTRMPGFKTKQGTASGAALGKGGSWKRRLLYFFVWHGMLKQPFIKAIAGTKKIVVLNDTAFPGSHIMGYLKSNTSIRTCLLQEGIRFQLPSEKGNDGYGSSGINHLLAWGDTSVKFFKTRIKRGTNLVSAGCPRFDNIAPVNVSELAESTNTFPVGKLHILYVSNPVDDQGYCSKQQKLELFKTFLSQANDLENARDCVVHLRLHNRENVQDYSEVWGNMQLHFEVRLSKEKLYDALQLSHAIFILSSTVGLEAALLGKKFGVIKLFSFGYAGDYVSEGIGVPVNPVDSASLKEAMEILTTGASNASNYVSKTLSHQNHSSSFIADYLLAEL